MQQQSMIDELHALMNFFPVSSNQQAVSDLLDHVEMRLHQAGLHIERIEHAGVHSLYASTRGQKHARVMLQSHIDVVPGGETFRQEDDRIYGRGCYDMLFAAASFLQLIDSLDNPAGYDISILLTGDEELGGVNGIKAILDIEQYSADVCILPDAGDKLGALSIAAKGICNLIVQTNGTSHHGSRPWEGDNAARKLVQFLAELEQAFDDSDQFNSTLTISQLQAGNEALNQGPATARAGIDIRHADNAEYERIRAELDRLMTKYDAEIVYEQIGNSYSLDTDAPIVKQFITIYQEEVGIPIEMAKAHGSSDARYFDAKNIPVIMCRPDGGNAHGDGEWLSISSWQIFHTVLERYVITIAKV